MNGKATTYKKLTASEVAAAAAEAERVAATASKGYGMLAWNYGGALILDGMYESIKQFNFTDWSPQIDKYLDG